MPHKIQLGKRERMTFSKARNIVEPPNLIDIQKKSYQNFLEEGLMEAFRDISPIKDHNEDLLLEFVECKMGDKPKYDVEECKERDATYAVPLKVLLRFINKITGEVKEQSVFMGDFPLMTEKGTFIINGTERVVVSQLVRSPGPYYSSMVDKTGAELFSSTVIPSRGAWLEYETDSNEVLFARIDRTRKLLISVILRALGFESNEQIIEAFGEDDRLLKTLEKDANISQKDALLEIYKKLRPGEPLSVKSAASLMSTFFFEERRCDLAKVGRYKFNRKLELYGRIVNRKVASDLITPFGELIARKDEIISKKLADEINDSGINEVEVYGNKGEIVKVLGNNTVKLSKYIDTEGLNIAERVYFPVLKNILDEYEDHSDLLTNQEEIKNKIITGNYTRAIHRWRDVLYEKENRITILSKHKNADIELDGNRIKYSPKKGFIGTDFLKYRYEEDSKKGEKEKVDSYKIINVRGEERAIKPSKEFKELVLESKSAEDVVAIKLNKKPENGNLFVDNKEIKKYPKTIEVDGCEISYLADKHFIGSDKVEFVVCYRDKSETTEVFDVEVIGTRAFTAKNSDFVLHKRGNLTKVIKNPENGTCHKEEGTVVYVPNKDFEGRDVFDIEYSDDLGKLKSESISINVSGKEIKTIINTTCEYSDASLIGAKFTSKAKYGKIKHEDDKIIYTPNLYFVGNDLIIYEDKKKKTHTIVINIEDDSMVTTISEKIEIKEIEKGKERVKILAKPKNGVARIRDSVLEYTPSDNFTGRDVFKYSLEILDKSNKAKSKETIQLSLLIKDNSVDTEVNSPVEYLVKAEPELIRLVGKPKNGSSKLTGNYILYTPKANFIGKDKVKYSVLMENGKRVQKFFTANVMGNKVPLAKSEEFRIDVGEKKIIFTKKPKTGKLIHKEDSIIYIPKPEFEGSESLEYIEEFEKEKIENKIVLDIMGESIECVVDETLYIGKLKDKKLKIEQDASFGEIKVEEDKIYYVPNEGFSGRDSFSYYVNAKDKTLKTFVVKVKDDNIYCDYNQKVILDSDKILRIQKDVKNGEAILKDDYITYKPKKNFSGEDLIEYEYEDEDGKVKVKSRKIVILANEKKARMNQQISLILSNSSQNVELIKEGENGKTTIVSEESGDTRFNYIVYKPKRNFIGREDIVYSVGRADGKRIQKAFTINVSNEEEYIEKDRELRISLGEDCKVNIKEEPLKGSLKHESGRLIYRPDSEFIGEDVIRYEYKLKSKPAVSVEKIVNVVEKIVTIDANSSYEYKLANVKKSKINILKKTNFSTVKVENEKIIYTPNENFVGSEVLSFAYTTEEKQEFKKVIVIKTEADIIEVDFNNYHSFRARTSISDVESYPLVPRYLTEDDILASINYIIGLPHGIGTVDDIDHLGNRRIRSVGELLKNQLRIGLGRLERTAREKMSTSGSEAITPQSLINIRPVSGAIKDFFASSQLSQFMDQTNPIAELTNKRRLSALGPGGLSRERAGFDVRDVHHSHYGRMCPIETPEGPNIGLIGYMSIYGKVNEYGFIETPYRVVDKENKRVTDEIVYITADVEDDAVIVPANEELNEDGTFVNETMVCRHMSEILEFPSEKVDYMEVSAQQMVSVATAMIPFLENDDASRALMGSNMQRQAVPLVRAQAPIVGTGVEHLAGKYSGVIIEAKNSGTAVYVSAEQIRIETETGEIDSYDLVSFKRSNQGTCTGNKPIINKGDKVEKGEIIADGQSTELGEIALGANLLIAFMTWEGYNYEDAILVSEELVKDDTLSSIHIEKYESEARETKLGPEEITNEIPNVSEEALKDLDEDGIIRIGAEVKPGDILVGKVTPKGETDPTPEDKLLRAIFGEKSREVKDMSLRVPHGESGIVIDVMRFDRKDGDELSPGVNRMIRVYIAKKRKISVGDKMAGRHGNKGVISKILPREDMPFLEDGTPVEVVLNPLGIPSRMNIGQVLEVHFGLSAKKMGWYMSTPVFDGASEFDIMDLLERAGYPRDGKLNLRDGRTGEYFDNKVTVGYMYMLKLDHLVDNKLHARSVGPYSLVTQQPLGGKAQFGGQRFGEMEVWALMAYGAAHTLQEVLTVKSDDVIGRVKAYEHIIKGETVPEPGVPESFKVLIKELQSLGIDVELNKADEDVRNTVLRTEEYTELNENSMLNQSEEAYDESEFEEHDIVVYDQIDDVYED